jgi:MFS family permease
MVIEMSKRKLILFIMTIFFSNIIVVGDYIFSPTINGVFKMFPDSIGLVNFIIGGTYLVIVIASLVAGKLCEKFSKKAVLMVGAICAAVGGILLLAVVNPLYMCLMRALFGVGYAFTQVTAVAFINDAYSDERVRGSIMGYYNASVTILGALVSVIAGNLATISLATAYRTYWLIIPYLILLLIFVPSIKPSKDNGKTGKAELVVKVSKKKPLGFNYWVTLICFALYCVSYCILFLYVSVYVAENALGNEALAGYLTVAMSVVGFFAAMAFGLLYNRLRKFTIVFVYIMIAISITILWLHPSVLAACIAYGIFGGCAALAMSYIYTIAPSLVPPERVSVAIGGVSAGVGIVTFGTTFVIAWVMKLMNTSRITDALIFPLVVMVVITLVEICLSIKYKDEQKQTVANNSGSNITFYNKLSEQ